jgi:DNA-binding MarR family transcriptional regulator
MQHEHDRRAILAEITPEGRRVAKAATERINTVQLASAPLATEQLDELFGLLRTLRIDEGDFSGDA